jgi:hypothetical protein
MSVVAIASLEHSCELPAFTCRHARSYTELFVKSISREDITSDEEWASRQVKGLRIVFIKHQAVTRHSLADNFDAVCESKLPLFLPARGFATLIQLIITSKSQERSSLMHHGLQDLPRKAINRDQSLILMKLKRLEEMEVTK